MLCIPGRQHVALSAPTCAVPTVDIAEDQSFDVQASLRLSLLASPRKAGYLLAATSPVLTAPQGKHPC